LRSSMPRIVSGENSSIADMVHCLFGAGHRVPARCRRCSAKRQRYTRSAPAAKPESRFLSNL
jgi:hypothetical protein